MSEEKKDIIYFDGECPICRLEINSSAKRNPSLLFLDVHTTETLPRHRNEHLELLHVQTSGGQMLKGLDANIYLWEKSHRTRLVWFARRPIIHTLMLAGYHAWAKIRYFFKYKL